MNVIDQDYKVTEEWSWKVVIVLITTTKIIFRSILSCVAFLGVIFIPFCVQVHHSKVP